MTESLNVIVTSAVGIVAAIVGTVAGVVLDRALRSRGKVYFHPDDCYMHFHTKSEERYDKNCTFDEARWTTFHFQGEIYNSADDPTGLRDVHVLFKNGRTVLFIARSHISHINLTPKAWFTLRFDGRLDAAETAALPKCDSAYLVARSATGKRYEFFVSFVNSSPTRDEGERRRLPRSPI